MEHGRDRIKREASHEVDRAFDQALAKINGGSDVSQLNSAGGREAQMRTAYRWTALHWAADNGHAGIVELLLSYNADVNAVSDTGKRLLDMASTQEIRAALLRRRAR
ncbi:hypothetical protein ACHAQJ_002665 [Trichoderma viride]